MAHTTLPVAAHLFLMKSNEILLLRRFNTGYEDGNYSVIAGHIDGGEDVYTAMIREAKEEAGVDIARENLEIIQVMHRLAADSERIDYFFRCDKWVGGIRNMEPDKCDELLWADINNPPGNTIGYIRKAIINYKGGIPFSIYGW